MVSKNMKESSKTSKVNTSKKNTSKNSKKLIKSKKEKLNVSEPSQNVEIHVSYAANNDVDMSNSQENGKSTVNTSITPENNNDSLSDSTRPISSSTTEKDIDTPHKDVFYDIENTPIPKVNKKIVFDDSIDVDTTMTPHLFEDPLNNHTLVNVDKDHSLVSSHESIESDSDDAPEEVQLSTTKEEGLKRREQEKEFTNKNIKKHKKSKKINKKKLLSDELLQTLQQHEDLFATNDNENDNEDNDFNNESSTIQRILIDKGNDIHQKKYNFDLVKLSSVTERIHSEGVPTEVSTFLNQHFYGNRVQRMAAGKYLKEKKTFTKKGKKYNKN